MSIIHFAKSTKRTFRNIAVARVNAIVPNASCYYYNHSSKKYVNYFYGSCFFRLDPAVTIFDFDICAFGVTDGSEPPSSGGQGISIGLESDNQTDYRVVIKRGTFDTNYKIVEVLATSSNLIPITDEWTNIQWHIDPLTGMFMINGLIQPMANPIVEATQDLDFNTNFTLTEGTPAGYELSQIWAGIDVIPRADFVVATRQAIKSPIFMGLKGERGLGKTALMYLGQDIGSDIHDLAHGIKMLSTGTINVTPHKDREVIVPRIIA